MNHTNEGKIKAIAYGMPLPPPVKFKFNVGDKVRITREKGKLSKGYMANFTSEVFTIKGRQERHPPVYKLQDETGEDLTGIFYAQELVRV